MIELIIDDEFKNLIPPLDEQERAQLEENILQDGIREPLTIWNNIIVDGHNRYEIAKKHNLTFKTVTKDFDDRSDAKIWLLKNQLGRRNLISAVRIKLALLVEDELAAKAKARMEEGKNQYTSPEDKCPQPTPQEKNKIDRQNKTNYQLAKMAGVSDKTVQRYKKIIKQAPKDIVAQVDTGKISINEGYKQVKQVAHKEKIRKQVEQIEQQAIEQPDGLFDVIVIDPPWGYVKQAHHGSYDANGRRGACPYPEMTQDELKAIKLPAAEDCVLFLWTTHKFIWDAKELLGHWHFDYRCLLVWDKQQLGLGNLIRMQCEFCLIGLKGNPVFKDVHDIRDLIAEPRREHSRKPDKFYQLVEELCTGRKLDYFSRQQREGWSAYGNDTEKFSVA